MVKNLYYFIFILKKKCDEGATHLHLFNNTEGHSQGVAEGANCYPEHLILGRVMWIKNINKNKQTNKQTKNTHTPLRGYAFKARISVWVCIRTINSQQGCMLTPYTTTEVSLEIRFLSLHTEWGSPLSYSPRFAHTFLALSKILGLYDCVYLRKFLDLTAIQTHTY